jgi:hypothetical protein
MSLYQQGGANQLPGSAPNLSLLDQTDLLGNPLDLDMSLPMDLDMDLMGAGADQVPFTSTGVPVNNAVSSQPLDPELLGTTATGINNGYGESSGEIFQSNQLQDRREDEKPMVGPGAGPAKHDTEHLDRVHKEEELVGSHH